MEVVLPGCDARRLFRHSAGTCHKVGNLLELSPFMTILVGRGQVRQMGTDSFGGMA